LRRLEEPSPKSSRPLTSLSSSGTIGSVPSRPVAAAPHASQASGVGVHPRNQGRPTVLPRRRVNPLPLRENGGTTRDVFHRVVFPASFRGIDAAFQPHRPDALRHQTGPSCACHTFDGVNRDSRTVSLGRVLVHAPLWSRLPAGFPRELLAPPEAEPLFRAHRRPCQRDDDLLRATLPSYGLPCGAPWSTRRMRTTDFCFPLLRLRVPVPCVLPVSLRGLRLALGRRACTRDQETGGPGISRRPIRFGGLRRVDARLVSPALPIQPYL